MACGVMKVAFLTTRWPSAARSGGPRCPSGRPPPRDPTLCPVRCSLGRARVGARQVIQEIDQALRALIRAEAFADRDVEVVFDAPTKEWAGRRNAPTVDVYLYDIREDMRRRERGVVNEYDGDGRSSAGTCRRGTSSCPTWSPPGPSVPRTSTGCSPRCSPASCGTTRSRRELLDGAAVGPRPARARLGRAAAARGPRLRRRVVRARRRAEAVARRRGQRPDRHGPAPRDRPAGRAVPPRTRHRWPGRVARAGDEDRPAAPGRRRATGEPPSGGVQRARATRRALERRRRRARAPARPGRAGRGPGAGDGRAPQARRPGAGRPVPRALPDRRRRRPAARGPRPGPAARTTRRCARSSRPVRPPGRRPGSASCSARAGCPTSTSRSCSSRSSRTSTRASSGSTATSTTTSPGAGPRSAWRWRSARRPADRSDRAPPARRGGAAAAPPARHRRGPGAAVPVARRCGCPTGSPRTCSAATTRTRR